MKVEKFWCSKCQTEQPDENFARNRAMRSGRANWCKACHKRGWQTPENQIRRKQRREANWLHSIVVEIRLRARRRGLPCDISEEDLAVPALCPVLGILLEPNSRRTRSGNAPSIDRIDPSRGYVKGNVTIISWQANRIKSDCGDPAVFEAIAAYIRRGLNGGPTDEGQLRLPLTRTVPSFPRAQATLGLSDSSSPCW